MKRIISVVGLFLAFLDAHAEDWTLTDGTVYKDVRILSHDTAFVTVMDSDGGARIPLRLLPAGLRTRFEYNAASAAAVEAAAKVADAQNAQAIQAEAEARAVAVRNAPPPNTGPMALPPEAVGLGSIAVPPELTEAEKQALRDQLAILWQQLNDARRAAAQAEAASAQEFESHRYVTANGEVEHQYTKGASQEGVDNHQVIANLMAQIDVLEGKLHGVTVSTPPPDSVNSGQNGLGSHHSMDELGQ